MNAELTTARARRAALRRALVGLESMIESRDASEIDAIHDAALPGTDSPDIELITDVLRAAERLIADYHAERRKASAATRNARSIARLPAHMIGMYR